jgi:hypothetical protein
MTPQGELTTRQVGEQLVRLARIKAGITPVLGAARSQTQKMEELYRDQNLKDPIYHDMKAVVGPLDRLAQRVDDEIEKILKAMGDAQTSDPTPDQTQNGQELSTKLKRRLRSVG